jgi:hypothetical protein
MLQFLRGVENSSGSDTSDGAAFVISSATASAPIFTDFSSPGTSTAFLKEAGSAAKLSSEASLRTAYATPVSTTTRSW